MIPVLSKSRDEIDISDIQDLIDSEVPEGEQIEFKETLPAKKGTIDPWMSGGNIGDRAKNVILEEAVAFANAHGGALLLGIKESVSKPPIASEISPIPRCAELAEGLKMVFRDRVEPQLPVLDIFAVPTESENGVVIIRVGRSRLAPHRVTKTLVCPIRRADRCEEMSMREIQDMTLNVSRGLERLDKRLTERSERFQEEFKRLETPEDAFGFRMTAAPVGDEIWFDRVFGEGKIIKKFNLPWYTVEQQSNGNGRVFNYPSDLPPQFWRPILRGTRGEHDFEHDSNGRNYNGYKELHCDGLVEWGFVARRKFSNGDSYSFPSDLIVSMFANLLVSTNHIRHQADAPIAEYVLEVEICVRGFPTSVRTNIVCKRGWEREQGKLQPGSKIFPRYPLGNSDGTLELLTLFHRDFWNLLGEDVGPAENNLRIREVG